MANYSALLRDPRWQKKRLEILQRDHFTCMECKDTASTLHVHHCYYEKSKMPWEYEDASLTTLCESCHKAEALVLQEKIWLCNALARRGARSREFGLIAHYLDEGSPIPDMTAFACAICELIESPGKRKQLLFAFLTRTASRGQSA